MILRNGSLIFIMCHKSELPKIEAAISFFFCEFINYNFVKFHGLSVGPVSMFELPDKDLKDGLYKQNLPLKILSIKKAEE